MKCKQNQGVQCNKCNKNAMPPVERRESCKESTVLLASGESTPRSPDANVQRRSSLQELSRLMTAEEALLAAEASDLAQSRRITC